MHSAFLTQSPFSMEALLNRPQLTAGVTSPASALTPRLQRPFSFPTSSAPTTNPYMSYPLSSAFPAASAMTPFFMSQLAAAGLSAFTGLPKLPLTSDHAADLDSPLSDEESRK